MTLATAITTFWHLYDGSVDYPVAGDEDYTIITALLNEGIEAWGGAAEEENIKWNELFADLTSAADGDKTTDGTSVYDCPTNFVETSSLVFVGGLSYAYCKPDKVAVVQESDPAKRIYWITGVQGAKKINFSPTPVTGLTIEYSYYKTPTLLSSASDVIEMKRPYFAIYHGLMSYNMSKDPDTAAIYNQKANAVMKAMIIDNELPPADNSHKMEDIGNTMTGEAFGR